MIPHGELLAWIEPSGCDGFVGAFVGEGATPGTFDGYAGRAPAIRYCSSFEEARQWVEEQAAAFDLPVRWVNGTDK